MSDEAEAARPESLPITLDGHEYHLQLNLGACRTITAMPGGLYGSNSVTARVLACDLDSMLGLIRVGLGVGPKALKELDDQVFREGLLSVRDQLSLYIGAIANGGKPLRADEEDGEGEDPQATAESESGPPSSTDA